MTVTFLLSFQNSKIWKFNFYIRKKKLVIGFYLEIPRVYQFLFPKVYLFNDLQLCCVNQNFSCMNPSNSK